MNTEPKREIINLLKENVLGNMNTQLFDKFILDMKDDDDLFDDDLYDEEITYSKKLLPTYVKNCDVEEYDKDITQLNLFLNKSIFKIYYVNDEKLDSTDFDNIKDLERIKIQWGPISCMRLADDVKDISILFHDKFNENVSNLNVDKVINMRGLFIENKLFNQDISKWNVGNVKIMKRMFKNSIFNGDIKRWNIRKVLFMQEMFMGSEFNQDISGWDVSKVVNMQEMFMGSEFNQDISGWDVSNIKNMNSMFKDSKFDQNISGWDVSKVVDFTDMFKGSPMNDTVPEDYFTVIKYKDWPTSHLKVGDVKTMYYEPTKSLYYVQIIPDEPSVKSPSSKWFIVIQSNIDEIPVGWKDYGDNSLFTTSWITLASKTEEELNKLHQDYLKKLIPPIGKKLTISYIYNIHDIDKQLPELEKYFGKIEDWEFDDDVTDFEFLFNNSKFNRDIRKWDVSNVTNMREMFWYSKFKQDISGWDVSKVEDFTDMFKGSPMEGIKPEEYFTVLKDKGSPSTTKKITQADINATVTYGAGIDNELSELEKQFGKIADWEFDDDVNNIYFLLMGSMFNYDISNWKVDNVINMGSMFELSHFNQDISNWNVGNVTNMNSMFKDSKFDQNISGWDVSKVEDFTDMFKYSPMNGTVPEEYFTVLKDKGSPSTTKKITQADIEAIVENKDGIDNELSELEKKFGKIEDWEFDDDVDDFYFLFADGIFNDDISNWNVSKIESMSYMFDTNQSFNQDISNWNVGNVESMNSMFSSSAFNQDISNWNVGNVTNMNSMFKDSKFDQNISGWDVSKVVDFTDMFEGSPMNGTVPEEYFNVLKIKPIDDIINKISYEEFNLKYRRFTLVEYDGTLYSDKLSNEEFEEIKKNKTIVIGCLIGINKVGIIRLSELFNTNNNDQYNILWWEINSEKLFSEIDFVDFAFTTNPLKAQVLENSKKITIHNKLYYLGHIREQLINSQTDAFELAKETERHILFLSYNLVLKTILLDTLNHYYKIEEKEIYFIHDKLAPGELGNSRFLFFQVIEFICDFLNSSKPKKIKKFNKKCKKLLNELYKSSHKFKLDTPLETFYNKETDELDLNLLFSNLGTDEKGNFLDIIYKRYNLHTKSEKEKEAILYSNFMSYVEEIPDLTPVDYKELVKQKKYENAYYLCIDGYIDEENEEILTTGKKTFRDLMINPLNFWINVNSKYKTANISNFFNFLGHELRLDFYSEFETPYHYTPLKLKYQYFKKVKMIESNDIIFREFIWDKTIDLSEVESYKLTNKINLEEDPDIHIIKTQMDLSPKNQIVNKFYKQKFTINN